MLKSSPPVLGFAAYSGTGKTTLLIQLIPLLKNQGLRIGAIKYSHHDVEIDQPGKDSYRIRTAGGSPMLLVSPYRSALITDFAVPRQISLKDQLQALPLNTLDLILVEGFRDQAFPKIELHRPILGKPLLYPNDPDIIAIATDKPLLIPPHLTRLDLNQPPAICQFIMDWILANKRSG